MYTVWLPLTWLSVSLLGAGLGLLVIGCRGRRLDDHRICRRCRFDLTGLRSNHKRCPECGAELDASRAVRLGNRRRRPWLIALGVPIALIGAILAGVDIWFRAMRYDFNAFNPTAVLVWELERMNPARADKVADELITRVRDDEREISDSHLARIRDRVLTVQADDSAAWLNEWGNLVYALMEAGALGPDDWRDFLRRGVGFSLHVRSEIAQGERALLQIMINGPRTGIDQLLPVILRYDSVRLGERVLEVDRKLVPSAIHHGTRTTEGAAVIDAEIGEHELEMVFTVAVYPPGTRTFASVDDEGRPVLQWLPDPTASWQMTLRTPVTVLPPETQVLRLVDGDDVRRKVIEAIQINGVHGRVLQRTGGMVLLSGFLGLEEPIIDLVMDVYFRTNGQEHRGNTIYWRTTRPDARYAFHGSTYDFNQDHVTIILRPNRQAALERHGFTEIFGEELIIENVPVEMPPMDDGEE